MAASIPVFETIPETSHAVKAAKTKGFRVGFVPTMGALHDGHAELVRTAARETDFVVVSIFVNPTQFGPNEDFSRYPRTFEHDISLCEDAGAELIFAPTVDVMYPNGPLTTYIDVPGVTTVLEGATRPGHFRGVATVVTKLLNIVSPDVAYFGQKDFQQLLVIRRMAADLNTPSRIQSVPTVREPDGLAMSSRNRYLDVDDRKAAIVLSRALNEAQEAVRAGERSADRVRQIMRARIESEGRANLDYAEVADAETLAPLDILGERQAVALIAARVGPARLIDNALLAD